MIALFLLANISISTAHSAPAITEPEFNDRPLEEPISTPAWFKLSFLDLSEDVLEAKKNGKSGILLYFGQDRCPYCKAMLEVNFGFEDIVTYTQKHYDVIAIDVRGSRGLTDMAGNMMSEKEFAIRNNALFTPTFIFYDLNGKEVHRLVGYFPPYTFRAALEYAADQHYKREAFRNYLSRGELFKRVDKGKLVPVSGAMRPPYILERHKIKAQRPMLVIFEQGNCHACDVLHAGPFENELIKRRLSEYDVVQLDIWSDVPVLGPKGKKMKASEWAKELDVFYTPTLIFFDELGNEIIRLGSVAHFNRIRNVMNYISSKSYIRYRNFADWSAAPK